MSREVWLSVLAIILATPAWWLARLWNAYYRSIAASRFESWLDSGEWRSPASQLGNAQLGVAFEWALGFFAIIIAYVIVMAFMAERIPHRRRV